MIVFALLHPVSQFNWLQWSVHWSTVIGLAALAGLYLWRGRARDAEKPLTIARQISFFSALIVVFSSLNGPLHDLSDTFLFTGHMIQHLLLTMLFPPLIIAGVPGWMLRPLITKRVLNLIARKITSPIVCFATFTVVMAMWHLPAFYNASMASHGIHIVEHLMFMSSAVMMWWPLMSQLPELPRLSYPGQMLYCFLLLIPMTIIAIYITMADEILYPAYSAAPRISPLSPRDDQLLGGLIMWVPGGMIFMVIMTVIFFRWAAHGEDDAASAQVDWKPKAV